MAVVALVQISAERSRTQSPISSAGASIFSFAETIVAFGVSGVREGVDGVIALPQLTGDNARLRADNRRLQNENARLHELAAQYAAAANTRITVDLYHGIAARVVGYSPENEQRSVTIDRGAAAGVRSDDGVVSDGGVVGRIAAVTPFSSTVVLVTDYTSRIPAIVRSGRWWGIARGNFTSVRLEYVAQDAPLKLGDAIVTGEGQSFHSGVPIGTVVGIDRADTTLYQTAIIKPSVDVGALDRVVVVPR